MIMFAVLMACGLTSSTPADTKPEPASKPVSEPVEVTTTSITPEVLEALKTADAADGVEDKVATKCSGCALGMDGDAAHTVTVDDYSLHLCSSMCKEYFSKDIAGNLKMLIN